jgi:hypothetical protein
MVRGKENRSARADSPMPDETEVEKSFWFSRPDGWVINRKTKKIILLEFKWTSDCGESYFQDMRKVTEKQHTPILTGLRALVAERGWEVEVVPLVTKGVDGIPQDLLDREGGWEEDHWQTGSHPTQRT